MEEQRSSYRQIFKATSLFGGVQIFNILVSVVKSKFVAVLLGPTGMGISSLLISTSDFVNSLTSFGLGISAVRNIADVSEDERKLATVVTVLRRLMWATGLLGAFALLVFSSWLSELTFDSKDYTYAYMFLSIALLFRQFAAGENALLQGKRKLKSLAKATLWGSLLGLFITVPLYYFFGLNGIVPAIISSALIAFFTSFFYTRDIKLKRVALSPKETWFEGKNMLTMGFMLSLSSMIAVAESWLVRLYITRTGSVADVGFFNAGFTIVVTYTGLIFAAMATDYYPRLSKVAHDKQLSKEMINQQAEIAILILAPILMVFFVYIRWIVQLLYSNDFTPVNEMIQWAALGVFFKAASWSVAFLYLAKGASKLFLINEALSSAYMLLFSILGYKWMGLDGLGIASLAGFIVYLVQVLIICGRKYDFKFNRYFIKIFALQLLCGVACFVTVKCVPSPYQYIAGSCLIVLSSIYSLSELNKRLALKEMVLSKIKRRNDG